MKVDTKFTKNEIMDVIRGSLQDTSILKFSSFDVDYIAETVFDYAAITISCKTEGDLWAEIEAGISAVNASNYGEFGELMNENKVAADADMVLKALLPFCTA